MGALERISLILLLLFVMTKSDLVSSPCAEMTHGYPNGTLTLSFSPIILKDYKFAVCFQSYSKESTFDVLDVTKRDKQPCKLISVAFLCISTHTEVCTGYNMKGILVDVEPKESMRFLDEIRYRTVTTVPKPHPRDLIRNGK
ncbi:hypothetical protein ACJMK2_005433 [Sinanodonta woodiana]|uniref:Uncharacterized protein n=1 Tax=Sinanodonta woodiana TaxID=1069815 RepID=A0ABD3VQJ1_SINWO